MIGKITKVKINDPSFYEYHGYQTPKINGRIVKILEHGEEQGTYIIRLYTNEKLGNYDYVVRANDLI